MEKESQINQKNEILDNLTRTERKRELLLRENERLKSDSKASKRSTNISQLITNPNALGLLKP